MNSNRAGFEKCVECFALVEIGDLDRHMEWHRYTAPVQRAGPVLDEKRRREDTP